VHSGSLLGHHRPDTRTDVSEEGIASIFRVTIIGEVEHRCSNYQPKNDAKKCYIAYSHPDDRGDMFLRKFGSYMSHTAYRPRRQNSSLL
jgi:hypothetical protein